ncbi:hypothetical protein WUBG_11156 [Wuchereria bancrofti]|uniref:Uncharacterized protein n=1 Tax=Wuchereria bancrofti TaxID=6293 RepID=J9ATZ2_WUCBA|nr:hypothetical protein WUBG_11156 [Wuchereria bancrofti]
MSVIKSVSGIEYEEVEERCQRVNSTKFWQKRYEDAEFGIWRRNVVGTFRHQSRSIKPIVISSLSYLLSRLNCPLKLIVFIHIVDDRNNAKLIGKYDLYYIYTLLILAYQL